MKKSLLLFVMLIAMFSYAKSQNSSPYWSLAGNSNPTTSSKLGTTSLIPLRFFTNNVERMRLETNGKLGLGTTLPLNIFMVKANGSNPAASWVPNTPVFTGFAEAASSELDLSTASNTADLRSVFSGKRSRGTLAVPKIVANNDYIASITGAAYDGSSFLSPAAIHFYVDGTPQSGKVPARISFETGTSRSDRLERLKILNNGDFNFNNGQMFLQQVTGYMGLGTAAPENKLHVKQAIPNRAIEWQHETQNDFWTVGIGTFTYNCRFEFNGSLRGQISSVDGSFIAASDSRLKEDVEKLPGLLGKIMQLKPSSYFFKDSRLRAKNKSLGFIAQDVEKIFPEVVYDFDGGFKGLNYSAFSVLAIKAIQEQQESISQQQEDIQNQQKTIKSLEDRIAKLELAFNAVTGNSSAGFSDIAMEQNSPNPFRQTTIFKYKIPDASTSRIKIYTLSGKLIKSLEALPNGQPEVNGNELPAATYVYTLEVDGKPLLSKKMILLK